MRTYEDMKMLLVRLGNLHPDSGRGRTLSQVFDALTRLPHGDRAVSNFGLTADLIGFIDQQRREADDNAISIVLNAKGECVAVTRATNEHRILKTIWSKA